MKKFLMCTISLLSIYYALHGADNKSMTSKKFLEAFKDGNNKEWLQRTIKDYGNQFPDMYKKAKQNDLSAMITLAKSSKDIKKRGVSLYWYSTIAQLKNIDSEIQEKAENVFFLLWSKLEYDRLYNENKIDEKDYNAVLESIKTIETQLAKHT